MRENLLSDMSRHEAFEEAVDWAIEQNLLNGLFKKYRSEVIDMILTEYDEEACKRTWYEDGVADGIEQGEEKKALEVAENLLKMNVLSVEQIAQAEGLPVEKILELHKNLSVNV